MADIARAPATVIGTAPHARPSLELVPDDEPTVRAAGEQTATGGPSVWRTAMMGALIGFVTVTACVTAAGALGGIDVGGSFGLGLFVGAFGGAGFGFMMGALVSLGEPGGATESSRRPSR